MVSWTTQRTGNRVQSARFVCIWLNAAQPLPTQCGCARMRSVRLTNGSCNPTPKSFCLCSSLLQRNHAIPLAANTNSLERRSLRPGAPLDHELLSWNPFGSPERFDNTSNDETGHIRQQEPQGESHIVIHRDKVNAYFSVPCGVH